jgi:hypothetical protein
MQDASSASRDSGATWAGVVGTVVVLSILDLIGLLAAFGPGWTKDFLTGPAAGWAQAIGGIAAVIAAFQVGRRQMEHALRLEQDRREHERRRQLLTIDALFANAMGVCLTFQRLWARAGDGPPSQFRAEFWTDARNAIARVDPMSCPSPDVVVYLTQAPRTLDELRGLYESYVDQHRTSFGTGTPLREAFQRAARELSDGVQATLDYMRRGRADLAKALNGQAN